MLHLHVQASCKDLVPAMCGILEFDKAVTRLMPVEYSEWIWWQHQKNSGTWQDWFWLKVILNMPSPILPILPFKQPALAQFAGYPVCRDSWAFMLGVGKHRLSRCRHTFQRRDGRSLTCRGGNLSDLIAWLHCSDRGLWGKAAQHGHGP